MLNFNTEFVSIPFISNGEPPKKYHSFFPVVLTDDSYDKSLGMSTGKSIIIKPSFTNMQDALEAARVAFLSTEGAIGYSVKGAGDE